MAGEVRPLRGRPQHGREHHRRGRQRPHQPRRHAGRHRAARDPDAPLLGGAGDLAVAAWLDDNPQQHREALDYALALDYEKTSLFMALLLRDQDRDEALQEWLAAYLSRLTPVNLPRHFQVVIDAATGKGASATARHRGW